jgi:hypothetical protein
VTAKLSESDFELSCTDVAVSVTLGGAGTDDGGVYVMLVGVAPVKVPHGVVAHAAPVSAQVTPLLVASFCTVALTTNAVAPVFADANLFVMLTVRAAVMVNVSASDLSVFATDVAVSVG